MRAATRLAHLARRAGESGAPVDDAIRAQKTSIGTSPLQSEWSSAGSTCRRTRSRSTPTSDATSATMPGIAEGKRTPPRSSTSNSGRADTRLFAWRATGAEATPSPGRRSGIITACAW